MHKLIVLTLILTQLTGCIAVPEIKMHEQLTFDVPPPSQEPVSYADLMCCYQCVV